MYKLVQEHLTKILTGSHLAVELGKCPFNAPACCFHDSTQSRASPYNSTHARNTRAMTTKCACVNISLAQHQFHPAGKSVSGNWVMWLRTAYEQLDVLLKAPSSVEVFIHMFDQTQFMIVWEL